MKKQLTLFVGASTAALLALAIPATGWAEDAASPSDTLSEVVITADKAGLLERKPSDTVFGLDKPLLETPRSASFVSDITIERYGIDTIDDLTAISPGTYTASFYGVPGALNIRGTLAESYFRGFKRIENRGTYSTPIGDAAQIEIVRGPPTPIYGAGKVGGLLNFVPKTAKNEGKYLSEPTAEFSATVGSYRKRNATAQVGVPMNFGSVEGGIYAYGEIDDSHSFYRGISPKRQLAELSADFDFGSGWTFSGDYMFYHSDGDVQTPGWNRLTQDLIDNQTYVTGRDTTLTDANGDGRIEPSEVGFYPFGTALYRFFGTDDRHILDTGVGTTKLDPRTIYIAEGVDFSKTRTHTGYLELAKSLSDTSALKMQVFFDSLSNDRFVSYGFPGSYRSYTTEARATYNFAFDAPSAMLETKSFVGASFRYLHALKKESFNSGLIALDRRDISAGAAANDIIDSPFNTDPAGTVGLGWEQDVHTNTQDAGVFGLTDITWAGGLNLMLGGRYDHYKAVSNELAGAIAFEPATGEGSKGKFTYTASLSWKTPIGLIPYVTYAKNAALEVGQAGEIPTGLFGAGDPWLSTSRLTEGGVKFQLLDQHLVGSLAFYRQERTRLSQGGGVTTVVGTRSKGAELEVRYIATDNVSFTFAGNTQHSTVKGPDGSFVYLPSRLFGVPIDQGAGGSYVTFNFSDFTGIKGDYEYTLIPHSVVSLYSTFTTDRLSWGQAGLTIGGSHVTKTAQLVPDPLVFPSYFVFNASAFVQYGPWEMDLNVDNIADKLYFTPDADSYANLGALPSIGREWRVTLKRSF